MEGLPDRLGAASLALTTLAPQKVHPMWQMLDN